MNKRELEAFAREATKSIKIEMDEKILYLYAKILYARDIADTFKELYGVEVSPSLILK